MTDYRALCEQLMEFAEGKRYDGGAVIQRARAALIQPEPTPPLEPRGCPTPGACSCPTAPTVPPDLIRALELAEAGLSDIGDADREPGDDLAWAEARAAQDLPRIRRTLNTWRDHSALAQPEPVAPTDEQWDALKERVWDAYQTISYQGERFMYNSDFDTALDVVRHKLARGGTPANALPTLEPTNA